MFQALIKRGFQIAFHSHADAILSVDFPQAMAELEQAIGGLSIPIEEIIGSGGGETQGTQRLRHALADLGWTKMNFTVEKRINGIAREAISHQIDHVKVFERGVIACEIEWNNKDPFYDRDLENFKRLHADGAISLGVIITRGVSMQNDLKDMVQIFAVDRALESHEAVAAFGMSRTKRQKEEVDRRIKSGASFEEAWANQFVSDKYGQATTHWAKLEDRVTRGVGNPCPLLLVGLPSSIVTFNEGLSMDELD